MTYENREIRIYRLGIDSRGSHWMLIKAIGDPDSRPLTIGRLEQWCNDTGQPPGQYRATGWRNEVQCAWPGP